jgi:hypothetical protein
MNWKQRALYKLMSEISEDCYCAGWVHGNEYTLWKMVADPAASRMYGQDSVTDEQLADLRAIAAETGGWIRWCNDSEDLSLPVDEQGLVFTSMVEWLAMYENHITVWDKTAGGPKDA